jgi:hypothetical protein
MSNEHAATLLREFFGGEVLARVAGALGHEDARLRATLVASQLLGVAMVRYIIRIEPLASASAETIVAAYAPTLQRYLTEELRLPPS